jgi:hypothetical protein
MNFFSSPRNRFVKHRRDRACDKVVSLGREIQLLQASLGDIEYNDNTAPDWEYLSASIERLQRRVDKHLTYIKETA